MNNKKFQNTLNIGNKDYTYYDIYKAGNKKQIDKLPLTIKILLENLIRNYDDKSVTQADIDAIVNWQPKSSNPQEIAYNPARVILQDFTGVPAIVDLSVMREAAGDKAHLINPVRPTELVIDHSVQVDSFASGDSLTKNGDLEYKRNIERYKFLKWAQNSFDNLKIVPPGVGIVHQVNLEYLARVVFNEDNTLYPDTLVGTDSHTTMANGLGVLAWGVGGIEAEAVMLGLSTAMLIPEVIGVNLTGQLGAGVTATDLVLTITEMLRNYGVVGKFVEFYGDGIERLSLSDRATIANMAPEYGATCGFFPIDNESLDYLELTNRDKHNIDIVEQYSKVQGLFYDAPIAKQIIYTDVIEVNLADIQPSIAGPKRPQDRLLLPDVPATITPKQNSINNSIGLNNGDIVIAAITSCTNTSNPNVILAAGLLAKKAVAKGLKINNNIKTSLAPGSQTVTNYLSQAGCLSALETIGFNVVGYGCTTCIGNSGPLPLEVSSAIEIDDLNVCAVLSGNRNFEGRVHQQVKSNYLASPPLVIAYALHGRMDIDFKKAPIGYGDNNQAVYLADIWPTNDEISQAVAQSVTQDQYRNAYANIFTSSPQWQAVGITKSKNYQWEDDSTYIKAAPFCNTADSDAKHINSIDNARVLAKFGDSITTDHISPAGAIKIDSPSGKYLQQQGVDVENFNSYGSRRGNHEIMMRGTFANVRLSNQLTPETQGGVTIHIPTNKQMTIYDAAICYKQEGISQIILAGKEYGSGSSRDWAAKGPKLLGVVAVIAQSYERIHRANLIGMGILPLEFIQQDNASSLGLTGHESFTISGIAGGHAKEVEVRASGENTTITFTARVRIDTPQEIAYYQKGGILPYIVSSL